MIYTIYEIPGVKIGCTDNFERRSKQQLSKGESIILEEYTDIYKASDRERELQAEKGYRVDNIPYWFVKLVMQKKANTPEVQKKRVANTDYKAKEENFDRFKAYSHLQREVIAIDPDGNRTIYSGMSEAARQLINKTGIKFYSSAISNVSDPKKTDCKTHRGYKFELA
mgnify:CR=1 FL=1